MLREFQEEIQRLKAALQVGGLLRVLHCGTYGSWPLQ
jgi:hypothetical protein